jgi:hypothetical protein
VRLVTRLVVPLVVDYFASRSLVIDNSASRRLLSSTSPPPRVWVPRHVARHVRGSLRRSLSTTSPPLRVRVPRHVARLVTRLVTLLVVDYSASHRLVVDYFSSVAHPGASAHRTARHAARRADRRRLLCLA